MDSFHFQCLKTEAFSISLILISLALSWLLIVTVIPQYPHLMVFFWLALHLSNICSECMQFLCSFKMGISIEVLFAYFGLYHVPTKLLLKHYPVSKDNLELSWVTVSKVDFHE